MFAGEPCCVQSSRRGISAVSVWNFNPRGDRFERPEGPDERFIFVEDTHENKAQ